MKQNLVEKLEERDFIVTENIGYGYYVTKESAKMELNICKSGISALQTMNFLVNLYNNNPKFRKILSDSKFCVKLSSGMYLSRYDEHVAIGSDVAVAY